MRVLWITNIIMPDIADALGLPKPVMCGWLYSLADMIRNRHEDVTFAFASVSKKTGYIHQYICGSDYYILPLKKSMCHYQNHLEKYWKTINEEFQPDIIHIHGTEYPHGLAFLKACPNTKVVVSIQGLLLPYSRYYSAGISLSDIFKHITLRDILTRSNMYTLSRRFMRRSNYEVETLKRVKHVIGRTSWDRTHTWTINPLANYHFCNEMLRNAFYNRTWNYDNCRPHTIFVSQAGYPIKGLHQLLKAMPIVLRYYPDACILVGGIDIIKGSSLFGRYHMQDNYGYYISSLIKKLKIQSHISFLGPLREEEMCRKFLESNVYVCPSSIENSPNSLGEAQMLGIPCIASYVGGVPDMMKGFEKWMYRFEEIEMLADLICQAFELREPINFTMAHKRHNQIEICNKMIEIYRSILKTS